MPSEHTPAASGGSAIAAAPTTDPSPEDYERLREELEHLMAEPVKDFPKIDELVDRLEQLQLAIKGEHGIKGNNPNE